ncbi:TPA: cell wall-binding protein Cwp2 [Clostridioides difficile]|uniref:cell wall-binding protein Cwp2 n=1 Tax=Clostridioides difficile TaxID=1496 RepID=UPI00017F5C7B|nr:cell wall-binding protein Cwp2 [Clostridioides difficile]MDN9318128.1 cell wall-binding protein Cwp2 [Clostridioides difficile]MDV9570361.1 cell wall-binding protein Cwp2 [Clostridioides difficile]MDV9611039.1 cell wall-binding protein Cwp2 [Clostridioides difficile]MDV9622845.1 cell wall-binding protein Cwp2 [Clostridioides difficile]MDV9628169.1 cell wall-binding protein Cwp2 [Clostridioides difficile]
MNRKNLSVIMAAAMISTSVATVFAAETTQVKKETITKKEATELVSKVRDLMSQKYTGGSQVGQPIYEIKVGETLSKLKIITNIDELEKLVNALGENKELIVTITDKGHITNSANEVVAEAIEKYENSAELSSEANSITEKAKTETNGLYKVADVKASYDSTKDKLVITLRDKTGTVTSKTIEIGIGDEKIDLTANPVDSTGTNLDPSAEGFRVNKIDKLGVAGAKNINDVQLAEITIKNSDLNTVSPQDLYDGYRLTVKGNMVANGTSKSISDISAKDSETGKYKFTIKYTDASGKAIELTVESTNEKDLKDAKAALEGNSKVKLIAGDDRYATAVAIAKQTKYTDNVVIVNSNKLVDGLAATPLAQSKKAPILLASDNEIPKVTLDYIKDIIKKSPSAKIYIVGGESAVSNTAKKQLESVTKNVERLAGDDRHTTSVAVAKAMGSFKDAFVVGAKGEADAMSIAAKAAELKAPIIVNGWNDLSADAIKLMDGKEIGIVGGSNNVSSQIENQLADIDKDRKVQRVEGETRHDTNAKVIETYYGKLDKLYIAKDGYGNNGMLVDALAAGPLAAGKGPILLAKTDITDSQKSALSKKLNLGAEVTQIGNGVELTVIQKIAKILGW